MTLSNQFSLTHEDAQNGSVLCSQSFSINVHDLQVKSLIMFTKLLLLSPTRPWPLTSDLQKTCYDKAENLPNKGWNFNKQTWGKIVYFLFVWLVGIGFRQNFFRVLPNFGDFGAKMSFFHYIINQKRNNFIKHCSPPCTKKPLISEMCIYIKSSLCKWGLGTRGGTMFYRQKTKGVSA